MKRLLLIAFLIEVGLVLTVVPWSVYWDRNYFAESIPAVHDVITNNYVRGAVSGLGVVNFALGILELLSRLAARRAESAIITIGHSSPVEK